MKNDSTLILIVDDDVFYLKILKKQLEFKGYSVITASDGKEGLEAARKHLPQLVISDWMMPGTTGEEFCRNLKNDPELNWIYFIMITAKDRTDDMVTGLESGADDYLIKPCNNQELFARINTGLRIVRLQRENINLNKVKAINQTAITLNHEINNPLQSIRMGIDLLLAKDECLEPKVTDLLTKMSENVDRIRDVTRKVEKLISTESKEYIKGGPHMLDLEDKQA